MFRSAPMALGLALGLAGGLSPAMAQTAPRYSLQLLADLPQTCFWFIPNNLIVYFHDAQ